MTGWLRGRRTSIALLTTLALGTIVVPTPAKADSRPSANEVASEAALSIGGPFTMQDQTGRTVTEADFAGRPMLLFFGFTQCPDICPTMLTQMHLWLDQLGPLADRLQPVFVTVDPARDTPEILTDYLAAFDERIVGLRGTDRQLADFAESYGAFYEQVPGDDGAYGMNHTANILLFNGDGTFAGTADFHDRPENALSKIRRLAERAGDE